MQRMINALPRSAILLRVFSNHRS